MNDFFLDLWQDLREKRLLPVAAVLLVALIAVPFVLVKPARDAPSQSGATTATATTKELLPIDGKGLLQPADESVSNGSALKTFLAKNPFKPIKDLSKGRSALVASTTNGAGAESGASGSAAEGGGSGSTSGGTGSVPLGGDTGGGGSQGGGGGSNPPSSKEQKYTYILDVTFSQDGKTRKVKGLDRLGVLPSGSNPLLVFLGVTASEDEAGFMVDSTLTPSGEGRCKPSPEQCSFVYIGAGAQESFTDSAGHSYLLRIDQIRKVSAEKAAAASAARAERETAATATAASASGAAEPAPSRRFVLPPLFDFSIVGQP